MTTRLIQPTQQQTTINAVKADPAMVALANATPAQIDAYIAAHVTDLASAKTALAFLAKCVVFLWQNR